MNAELILAGIDGALFDPSLVVSLRKLLVGLAVSGNLRTTAVGTVASPPAEMPSSDSLPIEPSELPAAGMTAERFVRLGSIAEVKKGETGIQKAKSGRFPLVVTAQQRATTDHYDFDGPSAIVPLVSSTGHGKASLHRLHYQDGQYAVGNILAAIFPRSGSGISARFLYEYLSAFKDELLVTRMTGTANVALTIGKLKEVPVPIVSPRCQEVVDELMALCDRLEAAQAEREARRDRLVSASLARVTEPDSDDATSTATSARFHLDHFAHLTTRPEHVKQLRQTILNLAVRGQLVPQAPKDESATHFLRRIEEANAVGRKPGTLEHAASGTSNGPYSVPPGWAWTTFGSLIIDSDSGWSPKTEGFPRMGDNWGVLKVSAVSWDTFLPDENKQLLPGVSPPEKAVVHPGDFLISRANTSDLIAKCVVVEQCPARLIMSDKIVRLAIVEGVSRRYLFVVNNYADFARKHYAANATGTSLSMKNVSRDVIYNLPIPLPPLAEQRRIVAKVDELMALCDQLEASLASAANERARLLEALLHEALAPAA